ncbi:transcriptional regulator [Streptomyces lydicus]|uniref:transcriptional regulator n=1 Tax=Streptomyces lydicus TaxID=47763 RepID=UPI0010124D9F|nr:transcriptional regulator [Streptomyces lydicus]MCZ1012146.1 transcriptional regulator [Streptomyces lydicus]
MTPQLFNHPLTFLRYAFGPKPLTAEQYLRLVADRHAALGYGAMATRREKQSRWESGAATPELPARLAIADLHCIPAEAVHTLPWPDWLLLALDNRSVVDLPWTQTGMLHALADTARGGPMDRRAFLIATGATLTGAADHFLASLGHPTSTATTGRLTVTPAMVDHLDQRLDHLRHLDDTLGGGTLRTLATEELKLASSLLDDARYTSTVGTRLHSVVAEGARLCGWLFFDSGHHAAAQRYFLTALRAAAAADDHATGANTLAFMAIQTYSTGNPADAVDLVEVAQNAVGRGATPRVKAMLHARIARAYAKTGQHKECAHALNAAFDAHAQGPHDDDPAWSYWLSTGELENLTGSCALDLGDPARALCHFDAALAAAYDQDGYHRDHALYLTRTAEAHLAQGDIEHACASASRAVTLLGGVASARSSSTLNGFRDKLAPHHEAPAASDFLTSFLS